MTTLSAELKPWLQAARQAARKPAAGAWTEHVGTVDHIGDGVASVSGLPDVRMDELLRFEDGTLAFAQRIDGDVIGCIMLGEAKDIGAGSRVWGTGDVIRVPVGSDLLGRVFDPLGRPLDDGAEVRAHEHQEIERPVPGIVDRDLVSEPLLTGVTVVDTMIPLGRGQRALVIGDRKTGKTALTVDAMINQRRSDVICVYAAVGQKASTVRQVVDALRSYGAFQRCIVVVGAADAPPGLQWIAPFAACTMAEAFRDAGQHALLVIDDLTRHAAVHRELSLLLRQPPGREAYPGDVFYLHARLLERAAKLNAESGGGSLTALPIAETQAGNLTAYIPTNLISITDGQIYLEPKLFYEGQKPAVNVGLSVSRVGGKTQAPAIKRLAESLRLTYAQFLELEVFTRFGAMVDARTQKKIDHGRRVRAILTQPEYAPLRQSEQVALLLAVERGRLDAVPLERVSTFRDRLRERLDEEVPHVAARLDAGEEEADDADQLLAVIDGLVSEVTGDTPQAADDEG